MVSGEVKKMRFLFIHDHIFPKIGKKYYESYGFGEEFINRYLSIFGNMNIIARHQEILEGTRGFNKITNDKVEFYTLKNFSDLKSWDKRKKIEELIISADIIIIRLPSIIGLYSLFWAKKHKKKIVLEVVGSAWDSLWNQNLKKKLFAPLLELFTKNAINKSRSTIYVTEKYLQKVYPSKGKSISCSNVLLNETNFNHDYKIQQLSSIEFDKKIIIGTCGSLTVYKGQQDIIKAIRKLEDLGYVIEYQLVGGGNNQYLRDIAKAENVEGSLHFLGALSHEEVFKWLDELHVYIQPSHTEGLPRATVEAMSRGNVVIGTDAGGLPELIDEKFIYQRGDVNQFIEIFKSLNIASMKEQSIRNRLRSMDFLQEKLDNKRRLFLNSVINEDDSNEN